MARAEIMKALTLQLKHIRLQHHSPSDTRPQHERSEWVATLHCMCTEQCALLHFAKRPHHHNHCLFQSGLQAGLGLVRHITLHMLVQKHTHTLQGGQMRGCILFTNCYGSRRRKKKSSPVCITSEHVRVKMSEIIHEPHNWANVVKGKKTSLLNSVTASLLSFLLNSPFPPPFIQEGCFP